MANQTTKLYPTVFQCGFETPLPKEVRSNHLALFIFSGVLTISTIFLNSITIIIYRKSTRLKEKTAHFMIMILSSNDLAVGLTSNIMFLSRLWKEYSSGSTQCHMYAFEFSLQIVSSGCSLMTLMVMSLERYAAICHPLRHRTKVTKRLLIKSLILLWIIVICSTTMSWLFFIVFFSIILPVVFLSIVLIFFIYARIFCAYRHSSTRVQQNGHSSQESRELPKNRKLAGSCLIAVLSLTFGYLPLVLVKLIDEYVVDISADPDFILTNWGIALLLLNSSVNSIVFFWRNKVLRDEAFAIIRNLTIFQK